MAKFENLHPDVTVSFVPMLERYFVIPKNYNTKNLKTKF